MKHGEDFPYRRGIMRAVRSFAVLSLLVASSALAGPVIIGGDDADDHGSTNGISNFNGWLYIQQAFEVIRPCVSNGNKVAVGLGCNGSSALSAFQSGFDKSNLPGNGWTRVSLTSIADITAFFDGTGATNVNNAGIIYMPTDAGNVSGGITAAQLVPVNANAAGLAAFVAAGGGLFTHDQEFQAGGFGWLSAVLPGIVNNGEGSCNEGTLNLTTTGQAQFPALTDAIMSNATPWHSFFTGNFGGLDVLVTGPCPNGAKAVILGGCRVSFGLVLSPALALNLPGTTHTVTATVKDNSNLPSVGTTVNFTVVSGPNAGDAGSSATDANGQATFTWTGDGGKGVDVVEACFSDVSQTPPVDRCARVTKFWDDDCNENGVPDACDISGSAYGGACAANYPDSSGLKQDSDGNGVPDECNHVPDCSAAVASPASLWPPNHQYVPISVTGVTDADGDPLTITVTGITQDEPLNTRGDGNTCPDGQIVDGAASVRAERTGTPGIPGNGRVYAIHYTASDGKGGECSGVVTVCVPHDQGQGNACIDDGQKYNSVGPCNGGGQLVQELSLSVATVTRNQATLEFGLPEDALVDVSVFDVAGRRLATLQSGQLSAGVHQRSWDMSAAKDGLYFVRLRVGSVTMTKRVMKFH